MGTFKLKASSRIVVQLVVRSVYCSYLDPFERGWHFYGLCLLFDLCELALVLPSHLSHFCSSYLTSFLNLNISSI